MNCNLKYLTIYGCPEHPLSGEKSRIKVGVTINPTTRFNDMLGHRPDLDISSINRRDIYFDSSFFRQTEKCTYLISPVEGKILQPDQFIHKMLILKGYKTPDKGNIKGKHKGSEVFIDVSWNIIDECITTAVNNNWNWSKCKKILMKGKPSYRLYIWQAWNIARRKDLRNILPNENILAEFSCPRFGKTLRELDEFINSEVNLFLLVQYNLSPVTSFITEINSWEEFANVEFYDATDKDISIDSLPHDLTKGKKIIAISLCGEEEREKFNQFCQYIHDNASPSKTIIKEDEVDYGSATEKSKYKLEKLQNSLKGVKIDMFSGTGEDKVNFKMELDDKVKASAIRISYPELLLIKNGSHYIFTKEYRQLLDPVRNKYEIEFIDTIVLRNYHSPEGLIKPIFIGLTVGQDILKEIEKVQTEKGDDDPRLGFSYAKINKVPRKYASVHQNIWKQFLGIEKLAGGPLDYRQATFGKPCNVFMTWVSAGGGMTKKHLRELAELLNNDPDLFKYYNFVSVCGDVKKDKQGKDIKWGAFSKGGTPGTNNRKAEEFANREIDHAKAEGKGVVFLAMTLAQRSFSVSRIDATVFYRDDLPVDSAEQKLSRVLTPGKDFYGNDKKCGYIFNLSLTPHSSLIQNYIFSEINEQARSGIPAKTAATRFFEVIDVFRLNQLGLVEQQKTFSDTDYTSYVKACRSMYARSEIREMVIATGDMDEFIDFVKWASQKVKIPKKERDKLVEFVDESRSTDEEVHKHHFSKKSDEDKPKVDIFTHAMILARRLLYESVLNMAAIYCSIKKIELCDIEKNHIKYSEILHFIRINAKAFELFIQHLKFESEEQAKKILAYMEKLPLDDKLTANLHSVIAETSFGKIWINDDLNSYFYTDTDEGKIHTPMSLVNEMMEKWKELVKGKDITKLTYLDPHCKTGSFLRWIHNELKKCGMAEENIQKQVSGYEDDPVYLVIAKHVSGISNIEYKNLTEEEERAILIISNSMKKFDVICGNPPYNTNTAGKVGGCRNDILWDKFTELSLSLLKDGGYLCYIHPQIWRKPEHEMWGIITCNQIHFLKIIGENEGKRIFNVGTKADWYVLQKTPYLLETEVVDENNKKQTIEFRKILFLPNSLIEEVKTIIAKKDEEKCDLIYDCSYHVQQGKKSGLMSEEKNNKYKYPCVYAINSIEEGGMVCWYSSTDKNGHFGISKVIINDSRIIRPFLDLEGNYGMTNQCFAIKISSKKEGEDIVKALNSHRFQEIIKATKWSNFRTDYRMFRYFRKDFWKEFVD